MTQEGLARGTGGGADGAEPDPVRTVTRTFPTSRTSPFPTTISERVGASSQITCPWQSFDCADRPIMIAVGNDTQFRRFVELLGRRFEFTEGEVVLDPFNGSGTTGVAALASGRRYVGIDTDRAYLDLTKRRIADLKL